MHVAEQAAGCGLPKNDYRLDSRSDVLLTSVEIKMTSIRLDGGPHARRMAILTDYLSTIYDFIREIRHAVCDLSTLMMRPGEPRRGKPRGRTSINKLEEAKAMIKRVFIVATLLFGGLTATASQADAGIVLGRVAPVRRVAARAALPPYPVTRRVVAGPIYRPAVVRPIYRAPAYIGPAIYGPAVYGPSAYSPGVSVTFGF